MLDLQGPKLRIGRLEGGSITLAGGDGFRLDLDETPGDGTRAPLPHPEIFAALRPDIWKQSHPEAIRTYRTAERRDRADRQQRRRARRRNNTPG